MEASQDGPQDGPKLGLVLGGVLASWEASWEGLGSVLGGILRRLVVSCGRLGCVLRCLGDACGLRRLKGCFEGFLAASRECLGASF